MYPWGPVTAESVHTLSNVYYLCAFAVCVGDGERESEVPPQPTAGVPGSSELPDRGAGN